MKTGSWLLFILLLCYTHAFSQAKIRRLGTPINHPSVNVYAPFVSADGNVMALVTDNAEDHATMPFFSIRENNDWIEPIQVPKNTYTRLNYMYGYSLSADGKKMYTTSMRAPNVGGYDILVSELKGKTWADPQNIGLPVNSKEHEGCASVTTDGLTMYFMRCGKMDQNKAQDCKLFVVKKKSNGQWDNPVELPANINTGNSQTPRIMADGETLFFSSDKMSNNKGGMDLYVTKLKNGVWSEPLPMDFVNTDKDDQFVSANALGRYLIKDTKGERKNEIVEYLIPEELRPRSMMKLEGKISDSENKPTQIFLTIVNVSTNQRVYSGKPNGDGSFLAYLMEGSRYEVSIDHEKSNFSFLSKEFDLTTDRIPQSTRFDASLKPVSPGDEFTLAPVRFKPNTVTLEQSSTAELQRLARVAKSNPALKFEIQVLLSGYMEDMSPSSPDLTEMVVDSVRSQYDEIDSLGQLFKKDTVLIKTRYHNDRTLKQGKVIVDYLVSQGANQNQFTVFVNAIPAATPDNRKLTIKSRAK